MIDIQRYLLIAAIAALSVMLLVEWKKGYYKRWKNNPKSVEGDAFAALALENYIRDETSWSARQSNFTASAFDSYADASSV